MLTEFGLDQIRLEDVFWKSYIRIIREKTIPYQYAVLDNDPRIMIDNENRSGIFPNKRSNALENLRIAAGRTEGERYGMIFQDSDVYKWLESVAYSLHIQYDPDLKALADSVVELIGAAQRPDGYIDTYFQVSAPQLVYRMMYYGHELYCMGHLLEALVAYHQAVGSEPAMEIAGRILDHLDHTFGYEEGKIQGADGHQEIELGLLKYYEETKDKRALHLTEFFLDVRGKDPDFYSKQAEKNKEEGYLERNAATAGDTVYLQAHRQPKTQRTAEGHAVRMMYMAAAMARLVRHDRDAEMLKACRSIWKNVVERRMYITAGVGSTTEGEAFTGDFDLPNDTMYCETCASIALVYFAYEMFKMDPRCEYMDVIERALYNGILGGASSDGIHFFYVNPLEVHGADVRVNPGLGHVKYIRPSWYSCACCPPNFARAIGSMQRYIYSYEKDSRTVYVNLWVESQLKLDDAEIRMDRYDMDEGRLHLQGVSVRETKLKLRIPYWARIQEVRINGIPVSGVVADGYLAMTLIGGTTHLDLSFAVPTMSITADPRVMADANRLAVQRGPFVFCAEQVDNREPISEILITPEDIRQAVVDVGVTQMAECENIRIHGRVRRRRSGTLYRFDEEEKYVNTELTMIPYARWANRGCEDMMVWIHRG